MVNPSKHKKASSTQPKKPSTTSNSMPSSSTSTSVEDPEKRAQDLREKARNDGSKLREAFWANLRLAAQEPSSPVTLEEREKLPVGIKLKSLKQSRESFEKAFQLVESADWEAADLEIASCLPNAALDEELIGKFYQLRGKLHYAKKEYFLAIRDLSMAKHLFVDAGGDTLFYRMRCYLDLQLPKYAELDYNALAEEYPEYPSLKSYKSKVSNPMPHDFQKLMQKLSSGKQLPLDTTYLDLVKSTILLALMEEFGFEELGKFLYAVKTSGYTALNTPVKFGQYLRDVFSATEMEDISEVFTHFLPEHTVPLECTINEVIDAVQAMGSDCHLVHYIGYSMCFSLAWMPKPMWNLQSTLFFDHIHSRFALQRALWHEYYQDEKERIERGDDDLGYFCNGGIGELPPPQGRIDYLYVTDHGASDYVRLHAVASAHDDKAVIAELEAHVPLNTFHVTLAPMIFAAARDAMPNSVKFMIERGAEVNIMDAADETPLDAAKVALEFRLEMLQDYDEVVPVEDFEKVQEVLRAANAKEGQHSQENAARAAFEQMFGAGAAPDDENDEFDEHMDDTLGKEDGDEGSEDEPFGGSDARSSDEEFSNFKGNFSHRNFRN